jgi:divinyl protochlorophyllide a 8-vinyl-reductase
MDATAPRLAGPTGGVVGPNAIIQTVAALEALTPPGTSLRILRAAALLDYAVVPPTAMVPERHVAALMAALRRELGLFEAATVQREAGRRTGDYLLAHRIPQGAQLLLRALPAAAAAALLERAVARHAWTFAGSGHLFFTPLERGVLAVLTGCPLCRGAKHPAPQCDLYAATFERLFRRLVSRHARCEETACLAAGAPACEFRIRW